MHKIAQNRIYKQAFAFSLEICIHVFLASLLYSCFTDFVVLYKMYREENQLAIIIESYPLHPKSFTS